MLNGTGAICNNVFVMSKTRDIPDSSLYIFAIKEIFLSAQIAICDMKVYYGILCVTQY